MSPLEVRTAPASVVVFTHFAPQFDIKGLRIRTELEAELRRSIGTVEVLSKASSEIVAKELHQVLEELTMRSGEGERKRTSAKVNGQAVNTSDYRDYLLHMALDMYRGLYEMDVKVVAGEASNNFVEWIGRQNFEHVKQFVDMFMSLQNLAGADHGLGKLYRQCEEIVRRYRDLNGRGSRYAHVDLVYLFIKQGYTGVLSAQTPFLHLEEENLLRALLENAIRAARAEPLFQIIGLSELTGVLSRIEADDAQRKSGPHLELNKLLLYEGKGDYYDVPKFAEALIRLARGRNESEVVLRFDHDVEANQSGLDVLVSKITDLRSSSDTRHFFLSGSYNYHNPKDDELRYYVDDFAVRFQFLIEPQQYVWEWGRDKSNNSDMFIVSDKASKGARYGLSPQLVRDFLEVLPLGPDALNLDSARSPSGSELSLTLSRACSQFEERLKRYQNGENILPETMTEPHAIDLFPISGAGLYISLSVMEDFPPFTNAAKTTFIDDAIKWAMIMEFYPDKILNAGLKDEKGRPTARIPTNFKQDRLGLDEDKRRDFQVGFEAKDIQWALNEYLPILLRGILSYNLVSVTLGVIFARQGSIAKQLFNQHRSAMEDFLRLNLDYQFALWRRKFKDLDSRWPLNLFLDVRESDQAFKASLVNEVLKTFHAYLEVKCDLWPTVVEAIKSLGARADAEHPGSTQHDGQYSPYRWLTKEVFELPTFEGASP